MVKVSNLNTVATIPRDYIEVHERVSSTVLKQIIIECKNMQNMGYCNLLYYPWL